MYTLDPSHRPLTRDDRGHGTPWFRRLYAYRPKGERERHTHTHTERRRAHHHTSLARIPSPKTTLLVCMTTLLTITILRN